MSFELDQPQLDLNQIMQIVNRCAEAYHYVKAELPAKATHFEKLDNDAKASEAFCRHLPVLFGLQNIQIFIACIGLGVSIGAIDVADGGRYSHLAITAMSAWKLANLTVPEARSRQHPPLPKGNHEGNHEEDYGTAAVAAQLPDRKTQNLLYMELRRRGIPVSSEYDLRKNPHLARVFCDLAQNHLDKLPPPYAGERENWPETPPEQPANAA